MVQTAHSLPYRKQVVKALTESKITSELSPIDSSTSFVMAKSALRRQIDVNDAICMHEPRIEICCKCGVQVDIDDSIKLRRQMSRIAELGIWVGKH